MRKKENRPVGKKVEQHEDHEYDIFVKVEGQEVVKFVIFVLDLIPSPKKVAPKEIVNSAEGIERIPKEKQKRWSCLLLDVDFYTCRNFVARTVEKYKAQLEMPMIVKTFQRYQKEAEIKEGFDECFKKSLLVAVFSRDNSFKEEIECWAKEAKKKCFYTAVIYIKPDDVKNEDDLYMMICRAYEGEDITMDLEKDDTEFLFEKRYERELIFNPVGSAKENVRTFLSSARPISSEYIIGDGNCGFRSIAELLTGSQDNHLKIRQQIQDFLANEIDLYERGNEENGWWRQYYPVEELRERIRIMRDPARDAGDVERYCANFDLIAAAILYEKNFVLCKAMHREENGVMIKYYYWEIHKPGRRTETVNILIILN